MFAKNDIEILIVDDDADVRENTVDLLSTVFEKCRAFASPVDVLKMLDDDIPCVILTDLRMPEFDGLQFAQQAHDISPDLPIILMTGYGQVSIAVQAMKQGIYDFVEKPFDTDMLIETMKRAVDKRFLDLSLRLTQEELAHRNGIDKQIIGQCPAMRQLKSQILRLASMDVPVLIQGDTGCGKELVARSLHEYSERRDGVFVPLNCAAIPDHLAEAELFGHAKGAFTDAYQSRKGKLEHAQGGMLFLDEVESLSLPLQAKLLRALSDQKITPLGSNTEIQIDCRVVSATKDELRGNDNFRQDLYFRLQVAILKIPKLSERAEDIVSLFEYFALQQCENFGIEYIPASSITKAALMAYEWPGNVRELINVATRYVINQCVDIISVDMVQPVAMTQMSSSLKDQVNAFEESVLRSKLQEYEGKVAPVLEDLKIERRTFNQKLNRYDISAAEFKKNKSNI